MRLDIKKCLTVAAIPVFAAAVWGSTRTDSTRYDVTQPVKIGQTKLEPGNYTIRANEAQDQLQVLQNGKAVATVPCHWIKLSRKANTSEILSNKDRVTRVEFQGRLEAVRVG